MICTYCGKAAMDPVKPWGERGETACRPCFAAADELSESLEHFGMPVEPIKYVMPVRPATMAQRKWKEKSAVLRSLEATKARDIARARARLEARGYHVEHVCPP